MLNYLGAYHYKLYGDDVRDLFMYFKDQAAQTTITDLLNLYFNLIYLMMTQKVCKL